MVACGKLRNFATGAMRRATQAHATPHETQLQSTTAMEKRRTKKQKAEDWAAFMEKLRNTPKDRLSKAAKYVLEHEDEDGTYWMDMKAVLK